MQQTQAQSYYLQTLQKRAYSDDKELKRQRLNKRKKKGGDKRKEKKRKLKRERKKERKKKINEKNNLKINKTEVRIKNKIK